MRHSWEEAADSKPWALRHFCVRCGCRRITHAHGGRGDVEYSFRGRDWMDNRAPKCIPDDYAASVERKRWGKPSSVLSST